MKSKNQNLPPLQIPLSQEALSKKQAERHRLLQLRKEVMARLVTAREMGDLSENGAYTAAKFELGSIGRQLRDVNHILAHAYVPEVNADTKAGFGKTITLENKTTTLTFTLVSQYESDVSENKFSLESPIGQAVLGKQIGETVTVISPRGQTTYQIIDIS